MSILSHVRNAVTSLIPSSDRDFSTVVYPTRGVGIIVYDGLGITHERPWCHRLITQPGSATYEPGVLKDEGDHAQPQHTLEVCNHQQEDFDLYTFCGIGGAFSANNIGLFEESPTRNSTPHFDDPLTSLNPGSGLPMANATEDMAGNPFGCSGEIFSSGFLDEGLSSGLDNSFSSGLGDSYSASGGLCTDC